MEILGLSQLIKQALITVPDKTTTKFLSPKSVKVKAKQHCSGHVKPRTRVQARHVRVSGCLSSTVTGYSGHRMNIMLKQVELPLCILISCHQ
jgi:hypothetical protein